MSITTVFKTSEGADEYLAAYDATLALWPVPHQALDVGTSFGTTHLNMAGAAELPPLVLIHGFGVSSTSWYSNIEPLSRAFHVYALDVINQMGRSIPTRRLQSRQDYAMWLGEVLDALELERASVVGLSLGGWIALNFALATPQRVERMALLSPAASFGPIAWPFILHFLPAVLAPTRRTIYRFLQRTTTLPLTDGNAVVEQLVLGIRNFKPDQFGIPISFGYSDGELRQIHLPTLLLVGEQDISCKPQHVLERAQRLIPHIEADLIPGGGHFFTMDQAELTNERVVEFLSRS